MGTLRLHQTHVQGVSDVEAMGLQYWFGSRAIAQYGGLLCTGVEPKLMAWSVLSLIETVPVSPPCVDF